MPAAEAFSIRRCLPADAATLAELGPRLFRQAYLATHPETLLGPFLSASFALDKVRADLEHSKTTAWLAHDAGGTNIGYAWVHEPAAPASVTALGRVPVQLRRIFIDAAWHGRGVAQALMNAARIEAARRGGDVLWLTVWQRAERPLAFYKKMGLRIVDTVEFPIGNHVDEDFVMAAACI